MLFPWSLVDVALYHNFRLKATLHRFYHLNDILLHILLCLVTNLSMISHLRNIIMSIFVVSVFISQVLQNLMFLCSFVLVLMSSPQPHNADFYFYFLPCLGQEGSDSRTLSHM